MKPTIASIRTPWDAEANIARAYAKEISEAHTLGYTHVPFKDHDVEMLNRDWYARIYDAICNISPLGLLTCRVNLQHDGQRSQSLGMRDDLNSSQRVSWARSRASEHGASHTMIGISGPELISGCFFVVHVEAYLKHVAPVLTQGFFGVDNNIHILLHQAGYPCAVLEGMTVWHRYAHLEPRPERARLPRIPLFSNKTKTPTKNPVNNPATKST